MSTSHATADPEATAASADAESRRAVFVTTHWSVVLTAGRSDTPRAEVALETLCQQYWHPLYTYVRRLGYTREDAQDLTQGFLAGLLERKSMVAVDPEKGRFRSFLLASLNHFLADQGDRARAQKRGWGKVIPLDFASAETRLTQLPTGQLTPERAFEQRWALTLLELVYHSLEKEYGRTGKAQLFAALRPALAGERSAVPYATLAQRLSLSEGAIKVAVHRLRERYRAVLRAKIAETVAGAEEVEDELRHLFAVLAG